MTYLKPVTPNQFPRSLTLAQFIQTVLVGISGIPGEFVRPKWQPYPPKQPDIDVNWIAFGINYGRPDANAYVGMDHAGVTTSQRQQRLEVGLSIYGPDAVELAALIADGFQVQPNLDALTLAKMGFTEASEGRHLPDLVNERFIDRVEMTVILQRQIMRTYPIVSILSASGQIHTVLGDEPYLLAWTTET